MILKVYSALNENEDFTLISTFIGVPDIDTKRVQFVIPHAVNCTKIKLEFVKVTPFKFQNDGSLYAGAAKFIFVQKVTTDYEVIQYHANKGFPESRIIPPSKFTYTTNGNTNKGPQSNLFDDNDDYNSYWESSVSNGNATIDINFTQLVKLDELIFGAYKSTLSNNYGFPLNINIYASYDENEELGLKATFQGTPGDEIYYQLTLRQPISCTRLKIEIFDTHKKNKACLTCIKFIGELDIFLSGEIQDDFTTQYVNNSYPFRGLEDKSLVVYDLPVDNDYLFIVEKQFYFHNVSFTCPDALMSAIKGNNSNQVIVKSCKFNSCSVKSAIGSGGAILSINCVLKCESSQFVNCRSKENGGGGGISIVLNQNINEDVTISKCKFSECSATFGGALYLYSNVDSNTIVIQKSTFLSNTLIESKSSTDSINGGSAIYVNAVKASIKFCKFVDNSGLSSVKVDNNFDKAPSLFLKETLFDSSVSIENCEFEIDSSSKSSLFYVRGNKKAVDTVVSNCVFKGKLSKGAHHIVIDSMLRKEEKPKLNIKSCRFSGDKMKSINLNFNDLYNSLVIFNLNDQIFDYDEINRKDEKDAVKSNSKALFVAAMSLIFIAIITLIAVILTISLKKSDNCEIDDKNDTLKLPLDANSL